MWGSQNTTDEKEDLVLSNQTQFIHEKPLWEDVVPVSPKVVATDTKPVKKKKISPLVPIAAIVLVLLVTTSILAAIKKNSTIILNIQPSPSPVAMPGDDVFTARLKELQQNFVEADPSQTTLPFPPVSLGISLD